MRAKYSITLAGLLLTAAAIAAPCPPALADVASRVAELRGVTGAFGPPCRLIEPSSLRAELDTKLRRDLPIPPELFIESLVRVGFVDGDPSVIYHNLLDFYSSQVLGFYEPQADQMVVVNTPAAGQVQGAMVWAHELAHAVQEHRFHLPSRLLAMRSDSDEQRAASAVAEGEAMLVMLLLDSPTADVNSLERAARAVRQQARALGTPAGVPDYFVADLVFPYTTGFTAALRAYRAGGWPAVDHLLIRPPTSTAALLHADRADTPAEVDAGDLPPVPEGWEEVLTDSAGEWGLSYLLGRRMEAERAATVASGWDGDRMRLIRERADPGRWAMAWRLRARTVNARRALEEAMQRVLPSLLARLAPPRTPTLTWVTSGRTLEVRAIWPQVERSPRSPS
jgi:hypothetical protein